MRSNTRNTARSMVLLGFAVIAIASFVSYWQTVSNVSYQFGSFRQIVIPILNPAVTIMALVAWWWLSRIDARNDEQLRILRYAYVAFGIQYVLYAALYLTIVTSLDSQPVTWTSTSLWLYFVGAVVICFGMILTSRTLHLEQAFTEADVETEEVS